MKKRSPVKYGDVPKVGLTPDLYAKGGFPQSVPLRGDLDVKYPVKFASVGGKQTKRGPGVGSTITGSSRRPDEIDRAPDSQRTSASWRSDVIRDNPNAGYRSRVNKFDLDFLKPQKQGRAPDQLKGRVMPTTGPIRKMYPEKQGRFDEK